MGEENGGYNPEIHGPRMVSVTAGFGELGIVLGPAFEKRLMLSLRGAINDCYDRPGNRSKRTVDLKLAFVPMRNDEGICVDVGITPTCSAHAKCPAVEMPEIVAQVGEGGTAATRLMAPDHPDQRTLPGV